MPFPPFEPDDDAADASGGQQRRRLRDIPLRTIFPSLLTLLAIGSGLTAIRFAAEGRFELAIGAIVLAGFLDGIDGRVARFLKSTSRFGAELDSLADFVNFGVAPALITYFALLDGLRSFGWIAALIYAVCVCLRLARFNVMLDQPGLPKWQSSFFVGVPAPAGAGLVLLPVYALLLGLGDSAALELATALYTVVVGLLMVSRLPTWSGKDFGQRIPRTQVLPIFILVVGFVAFLLSYPWETLILCAVLYFIAMPFAWRDWHRRSAAVAMKETNMPAALPPAETPLKGGDITE
jgi:CDP-diacylglycerol---serine O-phosphatidyltransferase